MSPPRVENCPLQVTEARRRLLICSTQHFADVGMGDKPTRLIKNKRVPSVTDANGRNQIPDKFQIKFSNSDSDSLAITCHGQRHEGFRAIIEGDRAVPDLPPAGPNHCRVCRKVALAGGFVQLDTRNTKSLNAGSIDQRDAYHCRNVTQHPQCIEPMLFLGAGRPRLLNGPAELIHNAGKEALNFARGGCRLDP